MNSEILNIPVSFSLIKRKINSCLIAEWEDDWKKTKYWFPAPDTRKANHMKHLSRDRFSRLLRWLTGHCFLNRQNNLVDTIKFPDPLCCLCGLELERAVHVLVFCPALVQTRYRIMGEPFLPPSDPFWTVDQLLRLLSVEKIKALEDTQD